MIKKLLQLKSEVDNSKGKIEIKNYKQLCSTLGIYQKTGNSKKLQLKELKQYIKYKRTGHKFIIQDVYPNKYELDMNAKEQKTQTQNENNDVQPVYIPDEIFKDGITTKQRKSQYSKYLEKLIVDLLAKQYLIDVKNTDVMGDYYTEITGERNISKISLTTWNLLNTLSITNDNYKFFHKHPQVLADYLDCKILLVNDFYANTHRNLVSMLETALNRLQKQSMIVWRKKLKIFVEEITYDDCGNPIHNESYHKYVDDEEEGFIALCVRKALNYLGFNEIKEVMQNYKYKEFKERVNHYLKFGEGQTYIQEEPDENVVYRNETVRIIHYVYNVFDIWFHKQVSAYVFEKQEQLNKWLLGVDEKNKIENNFNTMLIERHSKNITRRTTKYYKLFDKKREIRYNEQYSPKQQEMLKITIDKHSPEVFTYANSEYQKKKRKEREESKK